MKSTEVAEWCHINEIHHISGYPTTIEGAYNINTYNIGIYNIGFL